MFNIRTDMAVEAKEIYQQNNNGETPGVDVKEYKKISLKLQM